MYRIKQSYDSAAADADGLASNVTGDEWTLSANNSGDSLAHLITITGDAATDHSGKTADIVGTGPQGQARTETIALPVMAMRIKFTAAGAASLTALQHGV